MKRIALKIDVDTCRGALSGVPALLALLQAHAAQATFFFALGPDRSGRQAASGSLKHHYDLSTRLTGSLLPTPDIGRRAADLVRAARDAGHEVGVHAWDRVRWEQRIATADNRWIETEMALACARFEEILGERAQSFAAPGWLTARHALRLTQRLGFAYASDCRGDHPFIPVIDGEIVACPQLPTTLPTLDELLALDAASPEQAADRILQLSEAIPGDHAFTLRAELEGMKFQAAAERLLAGWRTLGHALVPLRTLRADLDVASLPRHCLAPATVPGRTGARMTQGARFLQD
jgi:peptidoglycan/xylan/chitin deacetylase (PgdA/CDA1 family)